MSGAPLDSMCGDCRWCRAAPPGVRIKEYAANLDEGEAASADGLAAWVRDAYPSCPVTTIEVVDHANPTASGSPERRWSEVSTHAQQVEALDPFQSGEHMTLPAWYVGRQLDYAL